MSDVVSQRTNARRVLAILVGLLASLLALQGIASIGSGGLTAFAQDASPSPGSRTIQILNPDQTTSEIISNKNDGVDTSYHLVAWVNSPSSGDTVQFQYVPEGGREINIVCGETGQTQAAFVAPDTYECHWDLTNVPEGSETGIVRAQLYSNSTTPVATDEEPAEIDREAETVEILYPRNGGEVGFYTQPGGASTAMIDVSTSGATTEGGQATEFVRVYYSVSAPGTEPSFILCGDEETTGGSQDSVRCTLTEDDPETAANEAHSPSQVTAIAAVPGFVDPVPLDPLNPEVFGAADAHRAFGYEQNPTTVSIVPSTQNATRATCSQQITATVTDSRGRQVVGVNVDVHAQGPTDNLSFDDSDDDDANSDHKPPENHQTEPAIDCEADPKEFGGQQGDHDQIGSDVKHIESLETAGGGTDDNGRFTFQLYSPDAGTTQFTAWADEDGNDRFCEAEAHGDGSIGWDTTAPSPTGVAADETSCPAVDASPSPSPTDTASPSPTDTASPSPTDTASPSPTGTASPSPTGTASPSPSPSPTDDQRPIVDSGPCEGYREGSRSPRPGGGEIIVGTQGADELEGSSGDDLICALAGRDVVRGRGGDDQIHGDRGHDDLRGNQGNDSIFGSRGLDVIRGGAGNDEIRGGGQDDTIRGYNGRDRIFGGGGNDTIRAGRHNDHLRGNAGDDVLVGGPGNDNCGGGRGDDRLIRC